MWREGGGCCHKSFFFLFRILRGGQFDHCGGGGSRSEQVIMKKKKKNVFCPTTGFYTQNRITKMLVKSLFLHGFLKLPILLKVGIESFHLNHKHYSFVALMMLK